MRKHLLWFGINRLALSVLLLAAVAKYFGY